MHKRYVAFVGMIEKSFQVRFVQINFAVNSISGKCPAKGMRHKFNALASFLSTILNQFGPVANILEYSGLALRREDVLSGALITAASAINVPYIRS